MRVQTTERWTNKADSQHFTEHNGGKQSLLHKSTEKDAVLKSYILCKDMGKRSEQFCH